MPNFRAKSLWIATIPAAADCPPLYIGPDGKIFDNIDDAALCSTPKLAAELAATRKGSQILEIDPSREWPQAYA